MFKNQKHVNNRYANFSIAYKLSLKPPVGSKTI